MEDKITCFKLNWYDCGLCCADHMVQEEVTIYRKDSRLVFKELNGYGIICSCEIVHIESDKAAKFFDFLNERKKMKCGMSAKIIAYRKSNDIDIQFEDGTVVQHRSYSDFVKAAISNPNLRRKK